MTRSANASASDVETLQEREHKFEVVDSFTVPDLNSVLPEGGHAAHRESVVLNAVYFDTEDRDLLGSGITLRRRTDGSTRERFDVGPANAAPLARYPIVFGIGTGKRIPNGDSVSCPDLAE